MIQITEAEHERRAADLKAMGEQVVQLSESRDQWRAYATHLKIEAEGGGRLKTFAEWEKDCQPRVVVK